MKTYQNLNPNKILIYRCGTLGDSIVSLPAIHLIKKKYPDAEFAFMTANHGDNKLWADTIYSEFNLFNNFITYQDSDYLYPWRLLNVIKKIFDFSPDLVIYMASEKNTYSKIIRDKLFFRLAGAKYFYPFYNDYKKNFRSSDKSTHLMPKESVRFVAGLIELGITDLKIDFNLPISSVTKTSVDKIFKENKIYEDDNIIALCPWSKMQSKRWPVERFIELTKRIIQDFNCKIVVVGGSEESDVIAPYISDKYLLNNVFILAGRLSILETAEVIKRSRFYLGNDTGPMHIAAAVGTPAISIFSARALQESWYPYGSNNLVIRKDVPCRFCGLETCIENKNRCLTDITVEEVYDKCRIYLKKYGRLN